MEVVQTSPQKLAKSQKYQKSSRTEKSKLQKSFLSDSSYPIDTKVYQISYKSDQNCDRQSGDKFHQTDGQTTDIQTDRQNDRQTTDTTDRQTTDRQTTDKIFIAVSQSWGPKLAEKKFQPNRKKKNFRDCSNICPPGLRTYNKVIYQRYNGKVSLGSGSDSQRQHICH